MMRKCVLAGGLIGAVLLLAGVGGAWAQAQDSGVEVVLDNDSVLVVLLTFQPGEVVEKHVNPEPELGIMLEGELTLITPAGREILKPGTVRWLAPLTPHETRNEGATPVKMWALLLKQSK
ncbi:MAG TPA: cupin domain-containing protein [Candidatus Methylomirabilis sp.]|nr:cupin domain-containing protein [Candidatus Methylomirabilis sp.]